MEDMWDTCKLKAEHSLKEWQMLTERKTFHSFSKLLAL